MQKDSQLLLFPELDDRKQVSDAASSTFTSNMGLPVHRWFRYSAGFAAQWVEQTIRDHSQGQKLRIFDPFAGSGTTLITAEQLQTEALGIDAHPFVSRIAQAKLAWRACPREFRAFTSEVCELSASITPQIEEYPSLIHKCFTEQSLLALDQLRRAYEQLQDGGASSNLVWLALLSILRKTSTAGTAQWQYILPRKAKRNPLDVKFSYHATTQQFYDDMLLGQQLTGPRATFLQADARTCEGVPTGYANLVITSPPYPNNYDYADALRFEMTFMREIQGYGDLQQSVRKHLLRSCTQHVPEKSTNLESILSLPELTPLRAELPQICRELADIRGTKGGKKNYHLMIASYFRDLALVWQALRRVCAPGAKVCFVIGDSAPYGVYVPVIPWLGQLAIAAGFHSYTFERTRDRNLKWKNRKHRVPLQEGRLWVEG